MEKKQKFLASAMVPLIFLALCTGVSGCGSGSAAPTSTPNATPSVSSISPASAAAGALAFMLTVNGSNFVPGSTVEWNGSSRTTTFVSSTQLQAHIMAADLASPGKVQVTVVNSGGSPSNGATFTIAADTISFQSSRALDGSNAANTNNTSNIWVMNPDGSNPTPLTKFTQVSNFGPAVWSPDGSKLVFASSRALDGTDTLLSGAENIWVMNADGSGVNPLTKLTANGAASLNGAWSPDGSKIVFESSRVLDGSDKAGLIANVWVMNSDGSGAKPLTTTTATTTDNHLPAWSPDGRKIVFTSRRKLDGSDATGPNGTRNIWIMNADGSALTPLTKLTAANADCDFPSWTPDGSKVLFNSERAIDGSDTATPHGTFNIWAVNADGSGTTALTKLTSSLGASSANPKASPDGSKIVFVSGRALDGSDAFNAPNSTQNVWVMNADGSNPTPLSKLTAAFSASFVPIWFPGGTKILFSSQRKLDGSDASNTNNALNIWVVNPDGTGAAPLTQITAFCACSDLPQVP